MMMMMMMKEVQGGHSPPKNSLYLPQCLYHSIAFYYFGISFTVGIPCSYVYLVEFLPFISLGSPLEGIYRITDLSHTRNMMVSTLAFGQIRLFSFCFYL